MSTSNLLSTNTAGHERSLPSAGRSSRGLLCNLCFLYHYELSTSACECQESWPPRGTRAPQNNPNTTSNTYPASPYIHKEIFRIQFSMGKPILIIATDNTYHNIVPWEQEGYQITHITKASQRSLEDATDDIEPHNKYAIIGMLSFWPLQLP